MKMLHECRATHALGIHWDVKFDGGTPFSDLTRGKIKDRSNKVKFHKSKFSCKKHNYLFQFCLNIPKMSRNLRTTIKNRKNAYEKVAPSLLPGL